MSQDKKYILRVQNATVEVSRECYKLFYKSRRREKYLAESDKTHGTVSYHALGTEDYTGEEIIPDSSNCVDDVVVGKLMREKLRACLSKLNNEELWLVNLRYFSTKTEMECADIFDVNQSTISRREKKILVKLKRLLES